MVEAATRKAEVLIEALPFLKRFHHQITVVKVGGEALEDPQALDSLLTDLVFLEQVGVRPILVHGGGKSITRAMEDAGLQARFHQGRRITDEAALAIVVREVERLNRLVRDRIFDLGGAAVGLVPSRNFCMVAGEQLDPDLGLVGKPVHVDRTRITSLTSRGIIPVVPPLSASAEGQVYNTNADDIALAVASAMKAAKLMFLSSVPGVLRDPKDPASRIASLKPGEVRRLVREGVVTGGMIPKVESCLAALESGVGKIHIVHAAAPHALLLEIFTPEGVGTELVPDSSAAPI